MSAALSSPFGSGSCSRMPETAGSAASSSMTAATSSWVAVPGSERCRSFRPASRIARRLLATYTALAGSSPTRMVARPGAGPAAPDAEATSVATRDRMSRAMAFPSIRAVMAAPPGQAKTMVWLPLRITRSSLCHVTARESTARSTSAPRRCRSATVSACVTRTTSCSMIGPSSRSSVT